MTLTTDNAHEFWEERYENRNTPWDRGETNPALIDWLSTGIPEPPAAVLVPGCGRGHEVLELARRGFSVTGIDLSERALDELNARLRRESLEAELVAADLLGWEPPRGPFDIIYEQTCLCALLPRQWKDYEVRLRQWLKPGGLLLALFMQSGKTDGPPFHCALPDMQRLFDAGRWRWPDGGANRIPHPRDVFEYATVLQRI
ncbi:MAG: methyltransferase domain-containing protein [Arenicellales bacterium]